MDEPVRQFPGVAEGRAALINACLIGVIGQDHVETQFIEEIGVQRVKGVDKKTAVESYSTFGGSPLLSGWWRRIGLKDELLAETHQIECLNVVVHILADVVIAVAGASERIFLSFDLYDGDGAAPIAFFFSTPANKRFPVSDLTPGEGFQIKELLGYKTGIQPFLDFQGDPERAHQSGIRWNDDGFAYQSPHCQWHRLVVTYPPLHKDFFTYGTIAFDTIGVVHADRVY